ncbi:NUDIX hydrolase [Glycomyces tarimensis]
MTFYLFDAGVVEDPDLSRLQPAEIAEFGFFPPDEAVSRSGEFNRERIGLAYEARQSGKTVYQPFRQPE